MKLPPLQLIKKVWQAGNNRLDMPYKINFVVTKECHSKCINCNIWQQTPKDELTLEEIIQFAKANPFLAWMNFTGGEPTDRKDLPQIINAFFEYCPELAMIHFPTNGLRPDYISQTTKEIILKINETSQKIGRRPPAIYATVSIDGPPEENDRLRGIEGDFDLAIETYKKLKAIPEIDTYIGMTLYPTNHKLIEKTFATIKSRINNFDYHHFHANLAHVSQHYYENARIKNTTRVEMIDSIKKYQKSRGLPLSPIDWIESQFLSLAERYIQTGKTPTTCEALSSSLFLTETGVVYPCSIWGRPIGNIRDTNYELAPIIQSARAQELREQILKKDCANCWTPCEAFQSIAAENVRKWSPFVKSIANSPVDESQKIQNDKVNDSQKRKTG